MANGKLTLGKQSGGTLGLVFPDGVSDTEVVLPESGELATKEYADARLPVGIMLNSYVVLPNTVVAFGGEFNRADYPKLWAYLEANPSLLKTQAEWTTENTTNGMCGYYSSGNGTTTFRVPNLDKAFLRPDSRSVGSYQGDMFKSHNHKLRWMVNGAHGNQIYSTNIGAPFNAGDGSESVGGAETRPKNIAVLPLIVAK